MCRMDTFTHSLPHIEIQEEFGPIPSRRSYEFEQTTLPATQLWEEESGRREELPDYSVNKLCESLGIYAKNKFGFKPAGFNYYEYKRTKYFVCFLNRSLLMRVTNFKFRDYHFRYLERSTLNCTIKKFDNKTVLIVWEKQWEPQFGFGELTSSIYNALKAPIIFLTSVKDTIKSISSMTMRLLLLDLTSFLLNLREGSFTGEKLVSSLLSVYTMHYRFTEYWDLRKFRGQSSTTVTDLLIGLSALGLPNKVIDAIKTFTQITGKRIFESDFLLTSIHTVLESLTVIIEHLSTPVLGYTIVPESVTKALCEVIRKLGGSLFIHAEIKNVCAIYTKYVSNPQTLFDPTFRSEITNTYNKLKGNPDFLDYIGNANNKYFKTTWDLFEANVVKSCKAFDTSGRDEPVCFVFEGGAGSGKSAFMNSFVALLSRSGLTTYCHSVPAAEDGKDFYDDYENQDVFVMDDVGQQGRSQWRYLINYVSPVKYPLPCATASKKNTKFFNSKIIVCTTNHFSDLTGFTASDCISEPSALFRRAHLIKVSRNTNSETFSQIFSYHKYDHIGSNKWEDGFINHFSTAGKDIELESTLDTSVYENVELRTVGALKWMYRVYNHILDCEASQRLVLNLPNEILDDILNAERAREDFMPQSFNVLQSLRSSLSLVKSTVVDVTKVVDEFMGYLMHIVGWHLKQFFELIKLFVEEELPKVFTGKNLNMIYLFGGVVGLAVIAFLGYFLGNKGDVKSTPEFIQQNLDLNTYCLESLSKMDSDLKSFLPQTDQTTRDRFEVRMQELRRSCRTLVLREESNMVEEHTQCVVSGNRILIPSHVKPEGRLISIYKTWEHYKNSHVEFENLKLKLVKSYFTSDLSIYEITTPGPVRFKLTKVFDKHPDWSSDRAYRDFYLINSTGMIRLDFNVHLKRNNESVTYSTVNGNWTHEANTGFYTPYSAAGGCGTLLVTPATGVLAFHVAGATNIGFCVQPPKSTFDDIVRNMCDIPESPFELRDDIKPGLSGVRISYTNKIEQARPTTESALKKSVFHTDFCEDVKNLIELVQESDRTEGMPNVLTTVPKEVIEPKLPPNFNSHGTAKKTLLAMEMKAFKHQGVITNDELDFMRKYLRSIMIEFDDVSDYEVAFGNPDLPPFSKTSSNGVTGGSKSDYFDFENKVIKPAMYELIEKVRLDAVNKTYDPELFTCRSAFKDELRKLSKVDSPRTLRVMPLGHTFWCKKIFGKLLKHFKNTRMETGISVGYNPYKDGDILAKKLLLCKVLGDADFGKWDGSIMSLILQLIIEVMGEFYRGDHDYFIEWFVTTIATSFVLINDELWWTTHGLPSGCWLTLMINCLINKCLSALVIYRNKPVPTINDVHRVVDFVTGDDKVIGADEEMSKYFNLETIKKVAESLGMDCTNGDKSPITKPSQDFNKLTYVKRHFRFHPVLQRYVGVLSLETILNTIQWVDTSSIDENISMVGKCKSMQIEAYLHSPLFYRKLTELFEKYFPYESFFTESRVRNILDADEGYTYVSALKNGLTTQWTTTLKGTGVHPDNKLEGASA